MFRKFLTVFLLVSSFLLVLRCGMDADVAGKVGDEVVSVDEFKTALKNVFGKKDLAEIKHEEKVKTLKEMLDFRLRVIKAKELGYEQRKELRLEIESKENNMIAQKLYEEEIVANLIPKDIVDAFYELRKSEIQAVAVILGYKGAETVKSDRPVNKTLELANELVARIRSGESSEKIAEKYSDDPSGKKRKGILDPYNPGMFDVNVDKALVTANAGDVLEPIFTEKGVFVIHVVDKKDRDMEMDYDALLPGIKKQIFQRFYREVGAKKYKEITEKFKKDLNAEIFDQNIETLLSQLKTLTAKPDFRDEMVEGEVLELELAKFHGGTFTGKSFIDKFAGRFYKTYSKYNSVASIRDAVQNQLYYDLWIYQAEQRGYRNDPVIKKEINRIKSQKLSALLENLEIRGNISFSEEDVNAKYEEDKNRFREKRKIEIHQIIVKDENLANRIFRQVKRNPSRFAALADKHNLKNRVNKPGGFIGYQKDNSSLGEIMKKAFEAGANQLLEPMRYGESFYIIKTGKFQAERQKPLSEVLPLVEGAIKQKQARELREKMMAELKERFPYYINDKIIRELK